MYLISLDNFFTKKYANKLEKVIKEAVGFVNVLINRDNIDHFRVLNNFAQETWILNGRLIEMF